MKIFYVIMAVWIVGQGVHGMPGCNDGESQFKGKNAVQHCSNSRWSTTCTVEWANINGNQVCSRIQQEVETVTDTLTSTKTESVFRTQTVTTASPTTVTVTSTKMNTVQRTVSVTKTQIQYSTVTTTEKEIITQPPIGITDYITKTVMLTPACTNTVPPRSMTPSISLAATPSPPRNVGSPPSDSELKSPNSNKIPDVVSYALAAATGVLFLLLLMVISCWVWTCCSIKRRCNKGETVVSARHDTPEEHHFENYVYDLNKARPPTEPETHEKQDLSAYDSIVEPHTSGLQEEPIVYEQVEDVYDYGTVNGDAVAATYEVPISVPSGKTEEERTENDYSQLQH